MSELSTKEKRVIDNECSVRCPADRDLAGLGRRSRWSCDKQSLHVWACAWTFWRISGDADRPHTDQRRRGTFYTLYFQVMETSLAPTRSNTRTSEPLPRIDRCHAAPQDSPWPWHINSSEWHFRRHDVRRSAAREMARGGMHWLYWWRACVCDECMCEREGV